MISFVYSVPHSQPILDSGHTKVLLYRFCKSTDNKKVLLYWFCKSTDKDKSYTKNKQITQDSLETTWNVSSDLCPDLAPS